MRAAGLLRVGVVMALAVAATGCGRSAIITTDALPLKRVVVYRNGIAYFERAGRVDGQEVRFKMRGGEVGDFLATLAVLERGGSSVRAASFPLKVDDGAPPKPRGLMTEDERKGLKNVVLSLDGKEHDLQVGYVAESPLWRPSYRLVVRENGEADVQVWGIVQNLSGEDWRGVKLSLVAGAPLAFESTLGEPVIPPRPTVTDTGEVIAAVPRGETTLRQEPALAAPPPPPPVPEVQMAAPADTMDEESEADDVAKKSERRRPAPAKAAPKSAAPGAGGRGGFAAASAPAPPTAHAEATSRNMVSGPRDVRALASIAAEGGATRFDLPAPVTVPDRSATMVMLLARRVPGEAIFLFSPDGGVPDSVRHPFRVARFANKTGGVLEKGPIAVFEEGAFLGQGMVDPLPDGATATVPFALERGLAVERESKHDELGERIAKIENGELTVERDAVLLTTYRVRNGGDKPAKVMVKHARTHAARLHQPPVGTEDNVGTGNALVPAKVGPRATAELVVDERTATRRVVDWFSPVADAAIKAFVADPRADRGAVQKLQTAWGIRTDVVTKTEARQKFAAEQEEIARASEETRRNLRAIEKNKVADQLRARLTARLGELAARNDEITKQMVELDAKLGELRVRFREALRELKLVAPPAATK